MSGAFGAVKRDRIDREPADQVDGVPLRRYPFDEGPEQHDEEAPFRAILFALAVTALLSLAPFGAYGIYRVGKAVIDVGRELIR